MLSQKSSQEIVGGKRERELDGRGIPMLLPNPLHLATHLLQLWRASKHLEPTPNITSTHTHFWIWAHAPKSCAKNCQWRWENTLRLRHGGGSLHCQVEHHMRDQKKQKKTKLHHKNGLIFYLYFFSRVDIHDIYYIQKIHNQTWLFFFNETYHF